MYSLYYCSFVSLVNNNYFKIVIEFFKWIKFLMKKCTLYANRY